MIFQAFRKKNIFLIIFFLWGTNILHAQNLIQYVAPFIGTGGHGHTYPGATVPFGMVQLSPDNGSEGWDWCSGYHYSDHTIAGFSHTHLSGTGCGDWVDISVMPNTGPFPENERFFKVGFSHNDEKASPGYYSVKMQNGIQAELTTTERCGFHKYYFPAKSLPIIRFDLGYHINYDEPMETYIHQMDDSTIIGYRYSKGWAQVQKLYFAARCSTPFDRLEFTDDQNYSAEDRKYNAREHKGKMVKGELIFEKAGGKTIMMKVALSTVNTEKALQALNEIPDWNFDRVKSDAEKKWETELEKIQINTSDDNLKKIFYTALYHTCMAPVLYSDIDREYKNAKGNVLKMKKGQRYTVFSLWDTFRGLNPLFTITQPERNQDILNSMLAFCDENGLLPVWDLSTWETNCMSGYHAVPVLADAVLKDFPGLDAERVYDAMKKSAFQKVRGIPFYIHHGYIPQDKMGHSVTYTLEYAYDDWCIAQVAKKLGKTEDYKLFMNRANAYTLLFDKQTGFIRGKNTDGNWVLPFDPYMSTVVEGLSMYEEGNAWQYTFFVPHDVRGLAKEYGSYDKFVQKLDSLFTVPSEIKGENKPPDVSGLIGQYAHGNEPSHHIAYMYDFVGQPWKTQQKIRMIVDSMYHNNIDGYAGNEDCGQMSAWAIWSIMGMYPANPASGEYVFGSPMADDVTVRLDANKTMHIKAINNAKNHPYIQSVNLNGKPYTKTYITHATLMQGGELVFNMGDRPNKKWGTNKEDWPSSVHN